MNKTAVLTFAMLGLSGTAFAAGVDSTAPDGAAASAPRSANHGHPTSRSHRPAPAHGSTTHRTTTYSTPARPSTTVHHSTTVHSTTVHSTSTRPVHTTTVHSYSRGTVVHGSGRPVPPPVHQSYRTVTYTHVYPYHGVFVYGPRPVTHVTYVNERGPVQVQRGDLPHRSVDRNDSFALGLKAGTLVGGTPDGHVYGDPGLGLVGQFRPAEEIGLEAAVSHHGMALDELNTRSQTQVAGSVDLYAFPWSRVSPYALAGVTWNASNFQEPRVVNGSTTTVDDVSSQLGLHAGLGLELALGKAASIDLEGRYIGWVSDSTPESSSAPGALQATAGVLVHFK